MKPNRWCERNPAVAVDDNTEAVGTVTRIEPPGKRHHAFARDSEAKSLSDCRGLCRPYQHEFNAIEGPLFPPLEYDNMAVHRFYPFIVRLNLVDNSFHTDKRRRNSRQNLHTVPDFEITHNVFL